MAKTDLITYVESSYLLSVILGDSNSTAAHQIWNAASNKYTSFLTRVECEVVIRRTRTGANLTRILAHMRRRLAECTVLSIDERILKIIARNKPIFRCRSLDAIHVATALYLKKNAPESKIQIHSFDTRILDVAKSLKLT